MKDGSSKINKKAIFKLLGVLVITFMIMRLLYLGSAYFPEPEGAGEEIYRIEFGEDGSFQGVWQ